MSILFEAVGLTVLTPWLFMGSVDLPIFIAPAGETRAVVENVSTERIQTTEGAISAQHYVLTELRIRLTRVDLWMSGGRLLRLDFPQAGISVVRDDLKL